MAKHLKVMSRTSKSRIKDYFSSIQDHEVNNQIDYWSNNAPKYTKIQRIVGYLRSQVSTLRGTTMSTNTEQSKANHYVITAHYYHA